MLYATRPSDYEKFSPSSFTCSDGDDDDGNDDDDDDDLRPMSGTV